MNPSTQQAYNSNSVQYGSKIQTIKRGATRGVATTVGVYILDSISVNRPAGRIEKPDEIGGDNGWVLVNKVVTGSCVVQMGPSTDNWPHNGDWFEDTLDAAIGVERFVISGIVEPKEISGYFKSNAELTRDKYAA